MWLKLSAIYTATFQNLLPRFLSVQKNRDRLELGPRLTGKREAACLSLSLTKLRRGLSSQVEGQPGHRGVPDTAGRHRWWGLQKAKGWYIVPRTTMKKHVCQQVLEAWGLGDTQRRICTHQAGWVTVGGAVEVTTLTRSGGEHIGLSVKTMNKRTFQGFVSVHLCWGGSPACEVFAFNLSFSPRTHIKNVVGWCRLGR